MGYNRAWWLYISNMIAASLLPSKAHSRSLGICLPKTIYGRKFSMKRNLPRWTQIFWEYSGYQMNLFIDNILTRIPSCDMACRKSLPDLFDPYTFYLVHWSQLSCLDIHQYTSPIPSFQNQFQSKTVDS